MDLRNDGSTRVSGVQTTDPAAAIHEATELGRAIADRGGPPPSTTAILAVEDNVPVERVVAALRDVHHAGLTQAVFLGESTRPRPVALPDPPDPTFAAALHAKLDGLSPADRAIRGAEMLSEQASWCPGLEEVFSAVANASPDARCELIAYGVVEALPTCPRVRGDKLITTLQVVLAPELLRATHVGVGLDPATVAPMSVPTGTPWSDVLPKLAAADPVPPWIVVP